MATLPVHQDLPKLEISPENLKDKYWRLNNLYYILTEKGDKVKFVMNEVQEKVWNDFWYYNLILKSRQHGMTTFMAIFELDECLFNSGKSVGIITHSLSESVKIFRRMIKFPYDNLDERLRVARPTKKETSSELVFDNDSSIFVGTSMRSGTLQILHVSEFGKICAKYPEKSREIVTGGFNTVHDGGYLTIESTAEGRGGRFYDFSDKSQKAQLAKKQLTKKSFKFHFYPWWKCSFNKLSTEDTKHVVLYQHTLDYFQELKDKHGINLTPEQKAWYVVTEEIQGEDMKREHPSTPEEAFSVIVEGAYYKKQFQKIYNENRICSVPYDSSALVDTYWDIGVNDINAIWFAQNIGREIHLIHYFEDNNEGIDYYAKVLEDLKQEKGWRYGRHVGPHDLGVREWGNKAKTRKQSASEQGVNFEVAPQVEAKNDGIQAVRDILKICWFDEVGCKEGIAYLEKYRKEWNEKMGTWKNQPLHDDSSNCADAMQTLAISHQFRRPGKARARKVKKKRIV